MDQCNPGCTDKQGDSLQKGISRFCWIINSVSWQRALACKMANLIVGCIKHSIANCLKDCPSTVSISAASPQVLYAVLGSTE